MEEEDNEFFILVLGVLAAIIAVICWWYVSGGIGTDPAAVVAPAPQVVEAAVEAEVAPNADNMDADADDMAADADADADVEVATDPEPEAEAAPEPAAAPLPSTVYEVLSANADVSVITGLLGEEGLDLALSGDGPFTVFAPTNDAVNAAASSDTTVALLESSRYSVLSYHVLPGSYSIEDLRVAAGDGLDFVTVQGEPLSLSLDGDNVVINGNSVVSPESVRADNGLAYTLDNLLVPPVASLNTLVTGDPILFASGSATIQQDSFSTLDSFVEVLSDNGVSVVIEGHTDSTGDPVLNQTLSEERARAVLNYLVANGIEDSRLTSFGFGSDDPVAENATEEGRALNRRIEFELSGE